MRHLRPLAAWFAVLAFASWAAAAPDDAKIIYPGAGAPASATTSGGGLGNVTLLVGVALAAVGTWLVWRARQNAPAGRELQALSIQETRSLGNRQYLVVAAYADKKFLLGVCPGQINFLAPLDDSSSAGKKSS